MVGGGVVGEGVVCYGGGGLFVMGEGSNTCMDLI